MLGKHDVGATIAVSDIAAARSFYENDLGLEPAADMGEAVVYSSGASRVLVPVGLRRHEQGDRRHMVRG